MTIPKKIVNFFEKAKVKYEPVKHRTVYTAHDKAQTLRVPEKIVGKTLVIKMDKKVGLVLIPANKNLDKEKLKKITKSKTIDFLKESWMKKNLRGVKIGTVPPFGSLWKLPTFIDKALFRESKIIINAGDYNWSIKISPAVLKKLIPDLIVGSFTKTRK
jgi:Ala-tRNA(Pro) deacylase